MYHSCWCLFRGLMWGVCCVCTLRSSYQSTEFIHQVCVQACTRATIIPMDAPDIPPPPLRQVYLKHVCQSHSIHIPNLSFLHPAHPHDTHTAPFLFIILLLCNCLDDNALHIMARVALCMKPMATICLHGLHRALHRTTDICTLSESNAYLALADLS